MMFEEGICVGFGGPRQYLTAVLITLRGIKNHISSVKPKKHVPATEES
jgi:hypothetical protein